MASDRETADVEPEAPAQGFWAGFRRACGPISTEWPELEPDVTPED